MEIVARMLLARMALKQAKLLYQEALEKNLKPSEFEQSWDANEAFRAGRVARVNVKVSEVHLDDCQLEYDDAILEIYRFNGVRQALAWLFKSVRKEEASPPEPSRLAEMLLYLMLPKHFREHLPGDLEEEFTTIILPKFGARYAKLWYWWQVIRSILASNKWIRWLAGGGGIATAIGAILKWYDD